MLTRTWPHAVDLRRRVIWAFRRQTRRLAGGRGRVLARQPGRCETIPGVNSQTADSAFIRACRRQPVSHAPVWYMRQAGRSLPEYRAKRAGMPMLDACSNPELITEITLQPVRRYGVDAAILFSDIVRAAAGGRRRRRHPAGRRPGDRQAVPRRGRRRERCATSSRATSRSSARPIGMLTAELGGTAADRLRGRAVHPGLLPDRRRAVQELRPDQGADVRQPGAVAVAARPAGRHHDHVPEGPDRRRAYRPSSSSTPGPGSSAPRTTGATCCRSAAQIFTALAETGVPSIHFGVGTGELLGLLGEAGADVVGVDWRVPLDEAVHRVAPGKALQGNLDPAVLLAPWPVIEERAREVLEKGRTAESHIFNLGHGVLPETDPDMLARLTDLVHSVPAGSAASAGSAEPGSGRGRRWRRPRQAVPASAEPATAAERDRRRSARPARRTAAACRARSAARRPRAERAPSAPRPATNPAMTSCAFRQCARDDRRRTASRSRSWSRGPVPAAGPAATRASDSWRVDLVLHRQQRADAAGPAEQRAQLLDRGLRRGDPAAHVGDLLSDVLRLLAEGDLVAEPLSALASVGAVLRDRDLQLSA